MAYMYRILRGGYPLTATYAIRISQALHIPLHELRPDLWPPENGGTNENQKNSLTC